MRSAAIFSAGWVLLLASCAFPTLSTENLSCDAEHPCSAGYVCQLSVCVPTANSSVGQKCEPALLDKVCSVSTGACAATGVTVCNAQGTVACSAQAGAASAEACDGVDNDCDGSVDEEVSAPACERSAGVCGSVQRTCQGTAGWTACTYPQATFEETEQRCDGLDNDCDGNVDEVPGCLVTLAGDGPPGFRDGPGELARLSAARYLALDAQGQLWVADHNNHAIRRIAPDGTVTTVVGDGKCGMQDGPVASAKLCFPYDIEVAADGTVYFSDFNNDRVRSIRDGSVSTVVGTTSGFADGEVGAAKLDGPAGISVQANGDILIADKNNHRLRIYVQATQQVQTLAGKGTAGLADGDRTGAAALQLKSPTDVVRTSDGTLYVSESGAHRIRKLPVAGSSSTLAGSDAGLTGNVDAAGTAARFNVPEQLQLDESAGTLYVADSYSYRVKAVPLNGTSPVRSVVGASGSGFKNGGTQQARMGYLTGMVRVPGTIASWLVSEANGVVRKAVEGASFLGSSLTNFAGGTVEDSGKDGAALQARLRRPLGLTRAADGTLYWVEREGGLLRQLTPAGQVQTLVGDGLNRTAGYVNGSLATARFDNARDVRVGPDGKLYVVESFNNTVRVVDLALRTVDTWAGALPNQASAGYVDSDDPLAARFSAPRALAFGRNAAGADVLYVSDEKNCVVRVIDYATRKVGTLAGLGPTGCRVQDGPLTVGAFLAPGPLAADNVGNVYVADGHYVRHIKPDGSLSTIYTGDSATAVINGLSRDGTGLMLTLDQKLIGLRIDQGSVIPEVLFQAGVNGWQNGMAAEAGAMRFTGIQVTADRYLLTDESSHRVRQLWR